MWTYLFVGDTHTFCTFSVCTDREWTRATHQPDDQCCSLGYWLDIIYMCILESVRAIKSQSNIIIMVLLPRADNDTWWSAENIATAANKQLNPVHNDRLNYCKTATVAVVGSRADRGQYMCTLTHNLTGVPFRPSTGLHYWTTCATRRWESHSDKEYKHIGAFVKMVPPFWANF